MTNVISITNARKPDEDFFANKPWGSAFMRELELVVAANVFKSRTEDFYAGYDDVALRTAERCLPLDLEAQSVFEGVVAMSAFIRNDDPAYQQAAAALISRPRGHWQIWSDGQGFDIWCSTGLGTINTPSGEKFKARYARSPGLDGLSAYASVISKTIYETHCRITKEISERSAADVILEVGQKWKNKKIDHQEWANIEYMGRGIEDGTRPECWRFNVSRRGKRAIYYLNDDAIVRFMGMPQVLPERYRADDNIDRTTSLRERRAKAAQALFDEQSSSFGFNSTRGSKAPFVIDGNTLERDVFNDTNPEASFSVTFEDGSDVVSSWNLDKNKLIDRNLQSFNKSAA